MAALCQVKVTIAGETRPYSGSEVSGEEGAGTVGAGKVGAGQAGGPVRQAGQVAGAADVEIATLPTLSRRAAQIIRYCGWLYAFQSETA